MGCQRGIASIYTVTGLLLIKALRLRSKWSASPIALSPVSGARGAGHVDAGPAPLRQTPEFGADVQDAPTQIGRRCGRPALPRLADRRISQGASVIWSNATILWMHG